ncbi:MAG: metal-sensing transcriptional repressor [Candidatus Buchananbacteria bacterium]
MEKNNIKYHANRVIGQMKGVGKMIDENQDPIAVISQIMAAKASLEKLAVKIIKKESQTCSKKRIDQVVDILFKIN